MKIIFKIIIDFIKYKICRMKKPIDPNFAHLKHKDPFIY